MADIAFPSIIPTIGTVTVKDQLSGDPAGDSHYQSLTKLIRLPEWMLSHGELGTDDRDGNCGG